MSEPTAAPALVGGVRPRRREPVAGGSARPRLVRLPGSYPAQGDTWLLASILRERGLARDRDVLDVCTGTGVLALSAHAAGARSVTAVDLSLRSTLNARLNALLNGARVSVVRGDLFAPVRGRTFDLVVCNPPYVPAAAEDLPRHTIARCWDAGTDGRTVLDRVCAHAPSVLADGGTLLVTHSAVVDVDTTLARLAEAGLEGAVVARSEQEFGPVLRERAGLLAERGLIAPGQQVEELVVIEARRPVAVAVDEAHARTMEAHARTTEQR